MELKEIIKRLKRSRPECVGDALRKCKFTLKHLGSGNFRDVYKLVGTPYIIKFPRKDWDLDGGTPPDHWEQIHITHSRLEARAWKKVMKKGDLKLLPYIPEILFSNERTGMILMRYFKPASTRFLAEINGLRRAYPQHDLFIDNFGVDSEGHLKIIDMAFLGAKVPHDRSPEEN